MTTSYAEACERRDRLAADIRHLENQHQTRRASLRASDARALDRQYEAQIGAMRAQLDHAEALAAMLGALPDLDVPLVNAARSIENAVAGFAAPALSGAVRAGQPLGEMRMTDYVAARGLTPDEHRDLSLQKYLRGMVFGDWQGADAERRAMAEGTLAAGGAMVPTPLSARIIDQARNQARVMQAGATVVPMETQTLALARVAGDPSAAWHSENATIAPSDATLEQVTLRAQTLAGIVQLSRELLEDAAGVDDEIVGSSPRSSRSRSTPRRSTAAAPPPSRAACGTRPGSPRSRWARTVRP